MPLDHYVPQVYLKNFYSPALRERMHAMRKSDLKYFTPNAKSVCGIHDGSTNGYLRNDRAIEELLKSVEPKYNSAVAKLRAGEIDGECIFVIAAFVAYIASCSPTAMRVQVAPIKSVVEERAALMEAHGKLPALPAALAILSGRIPF